jgi:hypothetical protein
MFLVIKRQQDNETKNIEISFGAGFQDQYPTLAPLSKDAERNIPARTDNMTIMLFIMCCIAFVFN